MPEDWLASVEAGGHGLAERERLDEEACAAEYLLMALRLDEGLDLRAYAARAGAPLEEARIAALADAGLLQRAGGRIRVPDRARLLTNAVVRELSP
jgi:oxygen-independent coproporphyrinogen-3 oxidase